MPELSCAFCELKSDSKNDGHLKCATGLQTRQEASIRAAHRGARAKDKGGRTGNEAFARGGGALRSWDVVAIVSENFGEGFPHRSDEGVCKAFKPLCPS
eukprot:3123864-Rhodomonas_salina.1